MIRMGLCALIALCLWGCDAAPKNPPAKAPGPDDGLSPVALAKDVPLASRKIVCLAPSLTETVFAIGAGDRVIGVSDFATYPPETQSLTRLGGLLNPNLERIVALAPDVIFLHAANDELARRLQKLGMRVRTFAASSLEEIYKVILRLGQEVGMDADAGAIVTGMKRELRHTTVAPDTPRVKVLVVVGRAPGSLAGLRSVGPGAFLHELIVLGGGENVAASTGQPWPEMSKEAIVAAAPDVIIELAPGATDNDEEALSVWKKLPSIPAVRRGQVHRFTEDHLLIPGPRLVSTARVLRGVLDAARPEPPR